MNLADDGSAIPSTIESNPGPGKLLRQAREAANLSVRDVSARMHLDEQTIQFLEDDRFDALPAPTFIRGYLRGYARLLEVPDGPIIEAFDRQGFKPPALVADISERQQARSSDLLIRAVSVVIVVALIGLVTLWWRTQAGSALFESATSRLIGDLGGADGDARDDGTGGDVFGADADSGTIALPGFGGPATGPTVPGGQSSTGTGSLALPPENTSADSTTLVLPGTATATSASPNSATGGADGDQGTGTIASATAGAADGDVAGERPAAEAQPETEGSSDTASASPADAAGEASSDVSTVADTAPPAPGEPSTLVLRFSRDSWLEVYDANDKRLFFNNARANRVVNVKGPTPMRLVIGRSNAVSIQFNGKDFDLSEIAPRGGIARFKIGS